jgi:glycosyltransferase involved in cell wall biosynthesis
MIFDTLRWLITRSAGLWKGVSWRRHVSILLAQNEQMGTYARRRLVASNVPVIVHPHASNPSVPGCKNAARTREILFIGRLLRWKGVLLALEAFARADVDNSRLVFIGEGEAKGLLQDRISRMGLQDKVSLAGMLPREEVLARLCTSSALLFPSFHDSAGFVVSEALSQGVPVICLNHGGPGALAALWPDVPHRAVEVGSAEQVVQQLAEALQTMVLNPAPVRREPVKPKTDLSEIIGRAYDLAVYADR